MPLELRAWDKLNNNWLFYEEEIWSLTPEIKLISHVRGNKESIVLMQYIGIKDKNGKKIFEGDIVKWNSWKTGNEDAWRVGQIEYDVTQCGFRIKQNYVVFPPAIYDRIEVIGNIFENSELLIN